MVDFENFLLVLEILLKETNILHLQQYRIYEKVEIFNLISMERLGVNEPDFKDKKISYLEALNFL